VTGTAVADAIVLTRRNLLHYVRIPSLIVFSTITPVMFVILFGYVFGGAIQIPGLSYIDFLMPGIFVQTVAFGAMQTGIGLAEDMTKGMVDRLRSLPMARSAVLVGRTAADTIRNFLVVGLMAGVGLLIGFRFHNGAVPAIAGLGLVVLFALAMSWISAAIGLSLGSVESAQSSGLVWVFPLTFASSIFVPVATMPWWLRAFARVNPVTHLVDALRALFLGGPAAHHVIMSLVWIAAILAVFVPLSVARFRRL
jgi:ABC-2 type transport system permease protein/oleandomycin transport system permease protein